MVQYYPINVIQHNKHHLHSTLCKAHFIWLWRIGMLSFTSLGFGVRFVWASPGFVHSDNSSKKVVSFPLVTVQQGLCYCIAVPLLHLGNVMGYSTRCKFGVTQNVVKNVEHSCLLVIQLCCKWQYPSQPFNVSRFIVARVNISLVDGSDFKAKP